VIGDNEPYFVSDETDYTIPRHGEARGLPHVEIEIRQDLISDDAARTNGPAHLSRPAIRRTDFSGKSPMTSSCPGFSRCRNRGLPYS